MCQHKRSLSYRHPFLLGPLLFLLVLLHTHAVKIERRRRWLKPPKSIMLSPSALTRSGPSTIPTAMVTSTRARWSSSLSRSLACEHVHHDRDSADPECARVSTCNTHAKFKDVYKEMELGVCAPATDFGVCQLSTSPTS